MIWTRRYAAGFALLRWSGAFVIVSALHAGAVWVALALAYPHAEAQGSSPILMMELAAMTVASTPPSLESTPATAADQPERLPASASTEPQAAALPEAPSPIILPAPQNLAPFAPQVAAEKLKEKRGDRPKLKREQDKRAKASEAAASNAAVPVSEARADTTAASAPGASAPSTASASWRESVTGHIKRFANSDRVGTPRKVLMAISIDRQGRILNGRIVQGAGDQVLDEESLAILRRASPVPPPPPEIKGVVVNLNVPFSFE